MICSIPRATGRPIYFAALFLLVIVSTGCILSPAPAPTPPGPIEYHNSEYGFTFRLPDSWKGYSIIVSNWTGTVSDPNRGDVPVLQGPLLSIRHPLWTEQNPRQDIPIMVFTHAQWDALQRGEFLVGAAPIGPRELGRDAQYVFALPARYDYASAAEHGYAAAAFAAVALVAGGGAYLIGQTRGMTAAERADVEAARQAQAGSGSSSGPREVGAEGGSRVTNTRETIIVIGDPFETPQETARRAARRIAEAKRLDMLARADA